jgi:hypothetical protein
MDNGILKYNQLLQEVSKLINNHFSELNKLLFDIELQKIFNDYNLHVEEHKNAGFNIFNLISDKYYYENLHSDIIAVFLDSTGEHNEGNNFLKVFIQLLQRLNSSLGINLEDFNNALVERENFRIDILIKDAKTQKAIIIENKINNASDTYRQLPTYVNYLGKMNVVAIVYLPLDPNKLPDKTGWTVEEENFINSKLICLPAFNRTENDFFQGWLKSSLQIAEKDDSKGILKQYSKLIQKIGGLMMDKKLFEDFYNKIIKETNSFNSILSIKSILDEFPQYLAQRIVDRFTDNPSSFQKVYRNGVDAKFEPITIQKINFTIVVSCEMDKYKFRFWDLNYGVNQLKNVDKVIKQLRYDGQFKDYGQNELVRVFKFPDEEDKLYNFMKEFKEKLSTLPNA